MRNFFILAGVALSVLAIVITACQKNNIESGSTYLKVRLTDSPFDASEVNVEILKVRVNFRNDSTGWIDLATNAGVYNLLALQNGVDTLLAQGQVPSNDVGEVRLILGTQNSIVIDSVSQPMMVPSGSQTGLKIKVDRQLNVGLDSLIVDFDAGLSVVRTGNNNYILKPVLRVL